MDGITGRKRKLQQWPRWYTNAFFVVKGFIDTVSQMQHVETRLRESILALDLKPGERLSEREIEARFSASRTPVRAALFRLEAEGLVIREGHSWKVAPIDLDESERVFAYRLANEVAAVKITCARPHRSDCATLAARRPSCDDAAPHELWHKIGLDFHVDLARLSGNEFLTRAVRDAMQRLSRAHWLAMRDDAGTGRVWREHAEILTAVERGDAESAPKMLTRHIESSCARLVATLREDQRGLRASGHSIVAT
jgi:DNA-binding GntR family transcriptional regulator